MKISPSSFRTWQECSRKYQFKYFDRRIGKGKSSAMAFGTAFHAGLDKYWQDYDPVGAAKVVVDAVPSMQQKVFGEVLMLAYHEKWKDSGYRFKSAEEEVWVKGWGSDGLVADGVCDLMGIWDKIAIDSSGDLCIVEHKTTRMDIKPESNYWVQRDVEDLQADMYLYMAKCLDIPVKYVLYDVIQVPKLKPFKRTPSHLQKFYVRDGKHGKKGDTKLGTYTSDETWTDFRYRVMDHIGKNVHSSFVRKRLYRTRADLARIESDLIGARMQLQAAEGTYNFGHQLPRSLGSCYNYRSECEYLGVCRGEVKLDNKEMFEDKE